MQAICFLHKLAFVVGALCVLLIWQHPLMMEIAHTVFLNAHCSSLNFDFPADAAHFSFRCYYADCSQGNFQLLIKRQLLLKRGHFCFASEKFQTDKISFN